MIRWDKLTGIYSRAWVLIKTAHTKDSCYANHCPTHFQTQTRLFVFYIVILLTKQILKKTKSRERETSTNTEMSLAWKPPKNKKYNKFTLGESSTIEI